MQNPPSLLLGSTLIATWLIWSWKTPLTWKYVLFTIFKQRFVFFFSHYPLSSSSSFSPLPWCQNRLCALETDGVKARLPYTVRCSSPCFLSSKQVLGRKFVYVFSLRHHPPVQAPTRLWVLFSLFLPFCVTSWLSGFSGISLSVRNSIKSFLYLDTNPVMTSYGHVFQVPPGWADRGRLVAVKQSPASFPVHPCGCAWWLSFKITPILLLLWGRTGGPPSALVHL